DEPVQHLLPKLDRRRDAGIEALIRGNVAAAAAVVAHDRSIDRAPDDLVALDVALGNRRLEAADHLQLREVPEDRKGEPRLAQVAVEIGPDTEALWGDLVRRGQLLARVPPRATLELVAGVAERRGMANLTRQGVR